MGAKCIVRGCKHYVGDKNIWVYSLIPIMKNKSRLREWCTALKLPETFVKPHHYICCKHFDTTDFNKSDLLMREFLSDKKFKSPGLLATATPTRNLPSLATIKRRISRANENEGVVSDIDEERASKELCSPLSELPSPTINPTSNAEGMSYSDRAAEIVTSENHSNDSFNSFVYEDPNDNKFCFSTSVLTNARIEENKVIESYNCEKETQTDNEYVIETSTKSNSFAFVSIPNLLKLFKFCSVCGSKILNKQERVQGSILSIHSVCKKGHKNVWYSQPIGEGKK